MLRTLFLGLLILLSAIPLSIAQDDTPTPSVADDFYYWSADVYFPEGIEFDVVVQHAAADISQLSLTIQYDVNEDPVLIQMNPNTGIVTTPYTEISYFWNITGNTLPKMFAPIRFSWRVVTSDNQVAEFTDLVIFEDTRVEWAFSADPIGEVNFHYADSELDVDTLRQGLRGVYRLLYGDGGNKTSYNVLVYPADTPIGCEQNSDGEAIYYYQGEDGREERECNLALAESIYERNQFLVFQLESLESLRVRLNDLIVENYYESRWGEIEVPAWFLRGLQLFYNPRSKLNEFGLIQRSARADGLLSIQAMTTRPTEDAKQALWDAQSISILLYMADTVGVDTVFELANSIGDYESFDEAYSAFIPQALDVLFLSQETWLFRSTSQKDFEYNPYLPDTPTPTSTATPSRTPTATYTPSKTPDVTATNTVTRTPIPPTATRTPLPAQSFSLVATDTPVPFVDVPVTNAGQSLNSTTIALIIAGAGILIVLVLYFGLRRR